MKYRKKPIVVEARRVFVENVLEIALWCHGQQHAGSSADEAWIDIATLEGVMRADVGDYVIQGVKGEFYPCKSDIFEASYEEVEKYGDTF